MKKVSIIIINYNDKLRIKRAIESALVQTWQNLEVLMVDDGSDAETRKIYEEFEFFGNGRFRLIQRERTDPKARTVPQAINAGLKEATGDYIGLLGCDNYFSPEFVEELMKNPADVMYCDWEIIGKQKYKVNIDKVWKPEFNLLQNYLMFTHLDHQCMLISKEIIEKVGLYDKRFPRSQDCDYIVRTILTTQNWSYTPKCLFHFEKHEDDQMKTYASIHGKTMWSLKNNLNIMWLLGLVQNDVNSLLSFYQGVKDFTTRKEWKEDFEKSEFKLLLEKHKDLLKGERTEKVNG